VENVTRFPKRQSRYERWRKWIVGVPADFMVAWVVCCAMVGAGYWAGRRECKR